MSSTSSPQTSTQVTIDKKPDSALSRFFYAQRGDSPFKLLMIHLTLILASIIAIYPVLRVLTISLRPGDRLLSTSLAIIPEDASFENYIKVLTDTDFLLWVWNSLAITSRVPTSSASCLRIIC